jgi:hypothetical protein
MDSTKPDQPEDTVEEWTKINEELGIAHEAAHNAAEDLLTPGPRKPASDAVEQERIDRARAEEGLPPE